MGFFTTALRDFILKKRFRYSDALASSDHRTALNQYKLSTNSQIELVGKVELFRSFSEELTRHSCTFSDSADIPVVGVHF